MSNYKVKIIYRGEKIFYLRKKDIEALNKFAYSLDVRRERE